MAVPGNVLSGRNRGGHALIRDGAKIIESADDIVDELGWTDVSQATRPGVSDEKSGPYGDPWVQRLQPGMVYELDEIAAIACIDPTTLLVQLTTLELTGAIKRLEGGRFVRAI